jgi:hypothetical protein
LLDSGLLAGEASQKWRAFEHARDERLGALRSFNIRTVTSKRSLLPSAAATVAKIECEVEYDRGHAREVFVVRADLSTQQCKIVEYNISSAALDRRLD